MTEKKKVYRRSTTGGPGPRRVDQTNWRKKLQESRIKFDDDAKERFLQVFREGNLMMRSCQAAGVSLKTVADHIKIDPDFAEKVQEAREEYKDRVLHHVQNLVINGVTNPVFAGKDGDLVGHKTEYPIQLIMMEAKKVDPAYKERSEVELKGGGGVLVAPADKSPEEWIKEQQAKNETRERPGGAKK